mgnify:CR=1 FL=1
MRITPKVANSIITQLNKALLNDIVIFNEQGVIIASNNRKYLQKRSMELLRVLTSQDKLLVTQENCTFFPNLQPGIYLTIWYHEMIIGVVGVIGNPAQLQPLISLIRITIEALVQQYYVRSLHHYQKNAIRAWVQELIYSFTDRERLVDLSNFLSLDITLSRSVFLLEPERDFYYSPTKALQSLLTLFDPRSISTVLKTNTLFIATPINKEGEEKRLASDVQQQLKRKKLRLHLGIGKPFVGLEGYRKSYLQANQAIQLQKSFEVNEPVHIDEWGVTRLMASIPAHIRKEFMETYGRKLVRLDNEALKTLETFLDCELNVSQTAAKLHIHRNTMLYRLKQIVSTLHLDPRQFNDAIILKILLLCYKLHQKK